MKQPILGHLSPAAKLMFLFLLLIFCFIFITLLGIVLAIPLFHVNLFKDFSLMGDFENPAMVGLLKYLQIVQSLGLFAFPVILAAIFFGRNGVNYLGMDRISVGWVILGTFLLMFSLLPFINWLSSINEMMRLPSSLSGLEQWMKDTEAEAGQITDVFLDVKTLGGLFVNLLVIAVVPAIGEELLFRGMLQRLFGEWFKNIHVAIFITAFIFGAIHFQFYGIIPRVFLGMILGYLFYWTKSLWIPIFAHFINNGSAVVISFLGNTGRVNAKYQDFGATNNGFMIAGSFVLTLILLFGIYWIEKPLATDPASLRD